MPLPLYELNKCTPSYSVCVLAVSSEDLQRTELFSPFIMMARSNFHFELSACYKIIDAVTKLNWQ